MWVIMGYPPDYAYKEFPNNALNPFSSAANEYGALHRYREEIEHDPCKADEGMGDNSSELEMPRMKDYLSLLLL